MTDDDDMAVIYYAIAKVEAPLDQGLNETRDDEVSGDPEESRNEETNNEEKSHSRTTTKTTRRVYNLRNDNNGY